MASKTHATFAITVTLALLFATSCDSQGPPSSSPSPSPALQGTCPVDTLKLGTCVDVLGVRIGVFAKQCCSLLAGLADLDAAVCLCTAIKASLLGIELNIPVNLSVLLNLCGKKDLGYQCP